MRWRVQMKGAAAIVGTKEYVEEGSDYMVTVSAAEAVGEALLYV